MTYTFEYGKFSTTGGFSQKVPLPSNPSSKALSSFHSSEHVAIVPIDHATASYSVPVPAGALITQHRAILSPVFGGGTSPSVQIGSFAPIANPAAPTITAKGTTGSTAYSYKIVALAPDGSASAASTAGSTATGNATLSGTNYNQIDFVAVPGAASYDIYRTVGGATQGKIGNVTALTFNDTGLAASGAAPSTNSTGLDILASTALSASFIAVSGKSAVSNASADGQTLFVTITGAPTSGSGVLMISYINPSIVTDGIPD